MKKIYYTIAILFCLGTKSWSQTSDTLTLKDLEIPNSPAFILLDQTPSIIERPASSKAFVLNVLNSFQENNGIPKNYAADFTPFWFFKHPNMTSLKFAGYNTEKNRQRIFGNIERASISFAFVTTTDTLTKKSINNLSLGLRFNLLSVRSKKDIDDIKKANTALIALIKERDTRLNLFADIRLAVDSPKVYKAKVKEFYKLEEENLTEDKNNLKDILARKPVFAIDGALGYNNFYIDNKYSDGHFGRFGAWMTANYSTHLDKDGSGKNYFNLYAIGRYLSDGTSLDNGKYQKKNFYDFGGKVELEFKKISIAYEYIYRINDISNTFRSSGLLKYKISDQLFLTGAFGKNFGTANNLISLLGLNWGLSSGSEKATVK